MNAKLSQLLFYWIVDFLAFDKVREMITPAQCRAGRGLLQWTQQDLAQRARVGIVTVHQLEAEISQPRHATLEVIRRAFESAGVEFIDENGGGLGVRFRTRQRKSS
jgi:transcriptional regulator with XRE-family HTH domain